MVEIYVNSHYITKKTRSRMPIQNKITLKEDRMVLTNHLTSEQYKSDMNCSFCGKQFNRGFNLHRHENEFCSLRHHNQEQKMSHADSSSDEMNYSEEDMSSGDESTTTTDNESEIDKKEDPWLPIINEAKERRENEFEEIKRKT